MIDVTSFVDDKAFDGDAPYDKTEEWSTSSIASIRCIPRSLDVDLTSGAQSCHKKKFG